MVQSTTSLPEGAGAVSSGSYSAPGFATNWTPSSGSRSHSSRELTVVEERSAPSTATIVGAAIAGAFAGANPVLVVRTLLARKLKRVPEQPKRGRSL